MTREEAIEILENHTQYFVLAQDLGALNMAIDALRPVSRAQVEKVWRGEWEQCFEDWRKQIEGDKCSRCGFEHYGTSIKKHHFCPSCGSPMTGEAVEMVMERMEALKDG